MDPKNIRGSLLPSLEVLLGMIVQVDAFSAAGASPLHSAVYFNQGSLVELLLKQPSCNIWAVNAQVSLLLVIVKQDSVAGAPLL